MTGIYLTKAIVTVCIPHLMREKLLRRCLRSLKKNVRLPYNIIIINDSKHPLSFADKRIRVVNNLERRGLGAARQQFAELVETEFLFALDDDVLLLPGSLEVQIEVLDKNPRLAAVSGLHFTGRRLCTVADFEFRGATVRRRMYDLVEILDSDDDLFKADFIPICHTTFRMKAIHDITFDPAYKIAYDHWDTFMQFYYTDWKCAVHKKSLFLHLPHKSPKEYWVERKNAVLWEESKRHFIKKWGYKPITPIIPRGTIFRKMFKRLAAGHVHARAYMRAAAMYTRAQIYQFLHNYT